MIEKSENVRTQSAIIFASVTILCSFLSLCYAITLNLDFLIFSSCILFIGAFIASVHISNPLSIYPLFLAISFLFLYSRVFLDLVTPNYDFGYCTLFTREILSVEIKEKILWMITVTIFFPTVFFIAKYKKNRPEFSFNHSHSLFQAGLFILFLVSPIVIYNLISDALYIFQNGYLAIFNGDMYENSGAIYGNVFNRLAIFAFYCLFASRLNQKQFRYVALAYLILAILVSLKGQRGELFLSILFILWYQYAVFNQKFDYTKLIFIGLILVFAGQYFLFARSGYYFDFYEAPFQFLHLNGASICVTGHLLNSPELLNPSGVPYLFSPIVDFFQRMFLDSSVYYSGPTDERLDASNYLGWHLTNFISPEAYFQGHGTGTSFLAEFYSLGGIYGVGILTVVFTWIALKIEENIRKKRWVLFIAPIILFGFVYMGRGSMIKTIDDLIPYGSCF